VLMTSHLSKNVSKQNRAFRQMGWPAISEIQCGTG
jgi:hypothetical protein